MKGEKCFFLFLPFLHFYFFHILFADDMKITDTYHLTHTCWVLKTSGVVCLRWS